MRPLNVLTWHVHGNYLYYLSQSACRFYVPYSPDRSGDYAGIGPGFPWPANITEVPFERVKELDLDVILFQRLSQYAVEQYRILTEAQRRLPRIYLEHDPPQSHPTDTRHPAGEKDVLLVHVTPFNRLMWNSGNAEPVVIEHGVPDPGPVAYTGELERGIAVVNNLQRRGRRLGYDVFDEVRREVPLDLAGMGAETLGGWGEVSHDRLAEFESHYRFFFNPIRYTSLGLAVCEAMMLGMPVVGLATTEMATAVVNGVSGFVDTDVARLTGHMHMLLNDRALAAHIGEGARRCAKERFALQRFTAEWTKAFEYVAR